MEKHHKLKAQEPQEPSEAIKAEWRSTSKPVLQDLWLHVLWQSLLEFRNAKRKSPGKRKAHEHKAVDWLYTDHAREVIELAGIDPDWFLEQFNNGDDMRTLKGFSMPGPKSGGRRPKNNSDEQDTDESKEFVEVVSEKGHPRKIPKAAIDIRTNIEKEMECP